ncbi:SDR family NAD(P)-dependent oxidoreductase [Streptomyces phytophilus]|uniref:SDR family NAD(P)-dependent oxidoreductase n=1 Tax=Streptomyces phytophilus TaxID=722715 RepID=UPI0015F0C2A9|nr:SDR family NAD(P)-dependent oxidoreductase [Streptomyces phytophilus]
MLIAQGRTALITGGGSGFGLLIARRLHAAGASVAVVDVDAERARDAAAQLGGRALGVGADVRSAAEMAAAVRETETAFGSLDTLVVSAGVFHIGSLADTTEEEWNRTLGVNLTGAFLTVRAAAPALRASGRGRIVTIGSDCGRRGFPGQVPYVASKFGLVGLTEAVAAELAPDGVTANCVAPVGCPTTGMGREVLDWKAASTGLPSAEIVQAAAGTNPLGRNATEDDVADAVLFFVSDQAGFLTGTTLDVDGGAHLGAVPGMR